MGNVSKVDLDKIMSRISSRSTNFNDEERYKIKKDLLLTRKNYENKYGKVDITSKESESIMKRGFKK